MKNIKITWINIFLMTNNEIVKKLERDPLLNFRPTKIAVPLTFN